MAKKAFSIAEYIKPDDVSKLDRPEASETVVKIPLEHICENKRNFYDTSNLGELANSIALNGLLEPVIVCKDHCDPDNGAQYYRLISGHRRFLACRQLAKDDPAHWTDIPAIIREPANPVVEELMLIEANRATRVMSSADTLKQAERYKALLVELKKQGVEIPGRLRDVVAEAMQISASRLARLEVIRKGLIPEYREDFDAGLLNESAAYELARLIPAHQIQIYRNVKISDYSVPNISALDEKLNMYFGPGLKCERNRDARTQAPGYCDHGAEMWEISRKKNIWSMCSSCCADCYNRFDCKSVCARVAPDVETELKKRKQKNDELKAQRERAESANNQYIDTFWKREKLAREAAGITVEDAFAAMKTLTEARNGWSCLENSNDLFAQESGCFNAKDDENDYCRDDETPLDLDAITIFADIYGCSVDYLMGRSEIVHSVTEDEGVAPSSGSSCAPPTTWRPASEKPKDGEHIIAEVGSLGDVRIRDFVYHNDRVNFPRLMRWIPYPEDAHDE